MKIKDFIKMHYRHFNAAVVADAAKGFVDHLEKGGKMFLTMAGAMSTAELGISLAEMIRKNKIHGISCTGANLEEDIFNLIAHEYYERIPHYRHLSPEQETALLKRGLNRVTDTCIPEEEALRRLEKNIVPLWRAADQQHKRYFPHEFFYEMIRNGSLKQY